MNVEQGFRILIVDDDPHVLRAHSRLLRQAGYRVFEAHTGEECLGLAQENKPDLILLDVVLPDVDGVEVCRRIKANPELRGTFVVLLSGLKTASDEQAEGLEDGADGYITRPIPNREFLARVRSFARIKTLESELRVQYEWLRVTLSSAGDGIMATDDEGRIEFMNPVAESVTGWGEEEAQRKPIEDVFTVVDGHTGEPLANPVRQVIRGRGTVRLDPCVSLIGKDGRRVPISDSAAPITDGQGEMVGVVLLFRDITERVQAEATRRQAEADITRASDALRTSEQKYRDLFNNTNDALFLYELTSDGLPGRFIEVNDVACERLKYSREEFLQMGVRDINVAADWEETPVVLESLVRDGHVTFEWVHVRKDGTRIPVEISSHLFEREGKRVVLSIARDITERVRMDAIRSRAEDALRASEELLRRVIDTSPNCIFVKDQDGRYLLVNRAIAELYGTTPEEMVGKTDLEFADMLRLSPEEAEQFVADDREVIASRRAKFVAEEPFTLPDGTTRWFQTVKVPLNWMGAVDGDHASQQCMLGVATDITQRKEAEADIARASDALRESEDRYRNLVTRSHDLVCSHDLEGQIISVNPASAALLGYDESTLLEMNVRDTLAPEVRDEFDAYLEKIRDDGVASGLMRVQTQAGERRVWEYDNVLRTEGITKPIVWGMAHDVTQRVRAQQRLRESEKRFRTLVESSPDHIFILDRDGTYLFSNGRLHRVGLESGEALVGRHLRDVYPPDVAAFYQRQLERVCKSGQVVEFEHLMSEEDGVHYHLDILYPIHRGGEVWGVGGICRDISERKRAEVALRQREGRLKRAHRLAQLGHWDWYVETNELRWSREVFDIFGRSPESFRPTAAAFEATIHPEDMDMFLAERECALAERRDISIEHRIVRPDGTVRYVHELAEIIRDDQGNVERVSGTVQDITERKRTEEAVLRYAERLRALRAIEGAILAAWSPEDIAQAALRHVRQLVPCRGAGILTFDLAAREVTLFAMDAADDVSVRPGLGLPIAGSAELSALQQGKVLVEQDLAGAVGDSLAPPAIQTLRDVGVRSYVGAPLIAGGKLIGVVALASDRAGAFTPEQVDIIREVADQLAVALHHGQLRAALEVQERRLAALVEHLPEGVLWLDSERRILLLNPAAEDCLLSLTDATLPLDSAAAGVGDVLTHLGGRPMGELLKRPTEGAWHELTVAGPPQRVFEVVARPVTPVMEGELETDAGQPDQVLLIRDVTAEREAQERNYRQERLAAVGQLAGGIAHDFNNMLTTIILQAEMTLGKPHLLPDQIRAFQTIAEEARKAANLVRQILDFSRRSPIEREPVDLSPFVKETVQILERTIPENVVFRLEMGAEKRAAPLTVDADPTRIQQVLMNLVVNARDAMPEGGELRIGLSRVTIDPGEEPPLSEMAPGEWVCMSVSDTGVGIPPDVLPHIFEPFFTTKEVGEGTGLGLAQVYGIVTQHGGHIDVETGEGTGRGQSGGTTFRVYLPAYKREEEEIVCEDEALPAPEGRGETILLVEDQERIRLAGQQVLESLGYRVLTAVDGREGLDVYRAAERVDLIITDVVMPEMGGREMIRELRKVTPDLKALAITGYILRKDLEELKTEGFLDVIHKPFDVEILAQLIRRALD